MHRERIWRTQAVAIPLLLLALLPLPYGYYMLLRLVCCPIFAYLGIRALDDSKTVFAYILFGTAFIYNPIFRIHLNRELWSIINIITALMSVSSMFLIRSYGVKAQTQASEKTGTLLSSNNTARSPNIQIAENAAFQEQFSLSGEACGLLMKMDTGLTDGELAQLLNKSIMPVESIAKLKSAGLSDLDITHAIMYIVLKNAYNEEKNINHSDRIGRLFNAWSTVANTLISKGTLYQEYFDNDLKSDHVKTG